MQKAIRKTLSLICISFFLLCGQSVYAQQKEIKGTVTDSQGDPLIGVTISIKGTTKGVMTDLDGNYTISVSNNDKVLTATYIGMKTSEQPISGNVLNFVMEDMYSELDEVVVIGYGTVQKKDLTGAVASLSAKDISSVPVSSVTEAMAGKLAGVNITTTEGSPDADIKIRVRGGGSLSQDNSPLYIVDGFPVSSISDIAPSEIQSIDILKDASSTAIYGARGANGVIIITTKSGKEGKTRVDFGASFGIRKVAKMNKVMSPYDYAYYQYELGSTDYGDFQDLDIWKSVKGTDYQDEIFGRTGNQVQYNVNVSGGTKDLKYNVGYAHNEEKSIMIGSGFRKDNVNAKINTNLNQWLSLDFNARLSYTTVDGLSGGADTNESNAANSIVANSARFRPINPLTNDTDDDENSTSSQKNPLERILATYKKRTTFNQNYNAGLNWTPFQNVTVRTEFGYGWKYDDTDQVWSSDAVQNSKLNYNGQPQAVMNRTTTQNWRNANTITYDNKKLFDGRDRLNVLLGHEVSSSKKKLVENTSVAFHSSMTIDEVKANMAAGTALPTVTTISADDNMVSFFGRANYTMMDKYILTATLRGDGSSKFGDGNQWGVFPSAAFAWRMSDEEFMKSTSNWLSNLKFRLSYGTAGNNRINSGLITTTYSMASNSSKAPFFDGDRASMLELGDNLYNPDLKWETTVTRNLGIDYGFWNNRISGALDFYWNTTKDLLMRTEIPANTGYSYQYQNFGQTSNKGVELTLNTVLVDQRNFGLNFNFNISYNRNKIDKLATENPWQSSNWAGSTISKYEDFRVEKGGRLGEVWGYKTNGYFTAYDAVNNPNGELILDGTTWKLRDGVVDKSPTITGGNYYPGALKVECDENGDPLKQKLGNTIAPVTGGFGFNGNVGNFDFNVFCNYSLGNKIINGSKLALSFYQGSAKGYNLNEDFALGNRYTWIDPATGLNIGRPSNTTLSYYGGAEALVQRLNEINTGANMYNPAGVSTMQLTDYAVESASFLRLNTLTVGYTFPKNWIKKAFLSDVRVYLTGYNLLCITDYSGPDPEVDTSSKRNAMTPGVDYASYPKSRSFVAGINVSF
ncbi:MAG: TonB-dependent receptor [Dysgonomonas sp.]|nr:TonB-dependent receptor [Dysgonomonas sp.]